MCIFDLCHYISNAPLELVMVASPDVMAGYCDDNPNRLRTSAAMQEDLVNKALEKLPDQPTVETGAKNPEVFYIYTDFSHMLKKDLDNKPTGTILSEDLEDDECSGSRSIFDAFSSSRWPPVSSYACTCCTTAA